MESSFPYEGVDRMRCTQYQLPRYHSDTHLHPVLNGMCGAASKQRVAAIWNVLGTFQPQLPYLQVRDTAQQWYFPPAEYKNVAGQK